MKKTIGIGWSLISGLLLYAAWPESPLTLLIFVGFCPLLFIADNSTKKTSFFWYCFLALLTWNVGTTWWIWNSTDVGSIAAIIANSLFMCLPWWGYYTIQKKMSKTVGYLSLVCFWMLFEYIHLNWQLSWPWLSLGNVFASHPEWVQWYEYTGVSGGTLWILLTNILLYELIQAIRKKEMIGKVLWKGLVVLIFPLIISFFNIFYYLNHHLNTTAASNVIIVQPNVNPYQKFDLNNASQQIHQLISLSEKQIDTATRLIVWPETAMSVADWQGSIRNNAYYQPIFDFVARHPDISLLSGIETFKSYSPANATATARKAENGTYYDAFNAAVLIKSNEPLQFYNKSKLVPGVESLPTFLNFMAPVFEKFGGTTGGYGRSDQSTILHSENNPYFAAPIICYESIYGEYVSSYVAKGANILTIITNDGWWGNTPGHHQHLQYARLRAIETRRWVARSANTGISAVIDDRGNILDTQDWDKAATLKYPIPVSGQLTFYVRFGDYLYKIASLLATLLIGWHVFLKLKQKKII